MTILTLNDVEDLGLEFSDNETALSNAIVQAQILAESPAGANRPLEQTSQTVIKTVPVSGRIHLNYLPVLATPAPQVQVRGGSYQNFGLGYVGNEWNSLAPTDFAIDAELGELTLKKLPTLLFAGFDSRRRAMPRNEPMQARITYTSGFDFAIASTLTTQIKSQLIKLVQLMASPASAGTKSFKLDRFYEISYDGTTAMTSSIASSPIDEALMFFRQFRPVSL